MALYMNAIVKYGQISRRWQDGPLLRVCGEHPLTFECNLDALVSGDLTLTGPQPGGFTGLLLIVMCSPLAGSRAY